MPLKGLSKAFTRPYKGSLKVCIDKSEKDYEAWAFHGDLPLQHITEDGQVLIACEWLEIMS